MLRRTAEHVRAVLEREPTGHDWHHIARVRRTALRIARAEKADRFIVELAALLYELAVARHPFADGGSTAPDPRSVQPGLPAALSAILMRSLSPDIPIAAIIMISGFRLTTSSVPTEPDPASLKILVPPANSI